MGLFGKIIKTVVIHVVIASLGIDIDLPEELGDVE